MQNSTVIHTWHSGKAVYTLLKIPDTSAGSDAYLKEPEIKRVVVGNNISAGETMVLVVPPGWWKRSATVSPEGHCLISETVTPGWVPDDHRFMAPKDLKAVCGEREDLLRELEPHVHPEGHELKFA